MGMHSLSLCPDLRILQEYVWLSFSDWVTDPNPFKDISLKRVPTPGTLQISAPAQIPSLTP